MLYQNQNYDKYAWTSQLVIIIKYYIVVKSQLKTLEENCHHRITYK